MNATYRHGTPTMVDYTPDSAVSAGDVIVVAEGVRIAHLDIAADTLGALAIHGGIYDIVKDADTDFTSGTQLYWDAGDSQATDDDDSGTNKYLGEVVEDSADGATTVRVLHLKSVPANTSGEAMALNALPSGDDTPGTPDTDPDAGDGDRTTDGDGGDPDAGDARPDTRPSLRPSTPGTGDVKPSA